MIGSLPLRITVEIEASSETNPVPAKNAVILQKIALAAQG
jgi:hypothetical protein